MSEPDDTPFVSVPGILLGRTVYSESRRIGFNASPEGNAKDDGRLIVDDTDSHTLVIAPTSGGKGRGFIIPNMLTWKGSAIIVDPKGEAARVTARCRREMGQSVFILDPFNELGQGTAQFNPLCRLQKDSKFLIDDAFVCASLLSEGRRSSNEKFWDELAEALEAGLIVHVATGEKETDRSLGRVYEILTSDDVSYKLACMLDTKEVNDPFAYRQIASFLQHEGEKVRTSVRSTAQQHMKVFASDAVRHAIAATSFDVDALRAGKPMTIYIVVNPNYLPSHSPIVRLWLSTLIGIITDRKQAPEQPTLFVVDEMASLGSVPILKQVVTLLRGYGLRAMLILQNREQLNELFPRDAVTVISNCNIVTFGHKNMGMSNDLAQILGDVTARELFEMTRQNKVAIQRAGQPTEIAKKLDYVNDPLFRGRFDANPMIKRPSRG